MGCYYSICHNTYAFSLLFYKVYTKRENANSWNSGLEKEQILKTYSAQLQKSWNSMEVIFRINKKYRAKKILEGATHRPWGWGRAPCLVGPLAGLRCPSSVIWSLLPWKKNQKEAFGTRHRRHEAEPWRNQSRAPAELFCRGNIPPGGENHRHCHHHNPLIERASISINIFTNTISSQTLVHLLYPIFVPKPPIGTCGLLVVLITPCSWC